jgi:solute carrier family 25 carnitine/acylcarnitine transporter 20/29
LPSPTSWSITKSILTTEGLRGLYFGGGVTALRDSIGYGFYFWSYELSTRLLMSSPRPSDGIATVNGGGGDVQEAMKVLLCGGLAGVVTWASIFPLDVIKTRVQAQMISTVTPSSPSLETAPLLDGSLGQERSMAEGRTRLGATEIAKQAFRNEGVGVFFRGLGVCSVRAFIVNAVQWAVYEWIMRELDPNRRKVAAVDVNN